MAANRKLTGVIKGRTVKDATATNGSLSITFDDDSTMKVKTKTGGEASTNALKGKAIASVQQQETKMTLTFADKSAMEVPLAAATSSVMLRDGKGALEYAD